LKFWTIKKRTYIIRLQGLPQPIASNKQARIFASVSRSWCFFLW